MANISNANVTIEIVGPVNEFIDYAKKVSNDAAYTLIDEQALELYEVETLLNGRSRTLLHGYAEGRWSYSYNLEAYFAPLDAKESWREANDEAQIAFGKLVSSLKKDKEAFVDISYIDMETGAGFIDKGTLFINRQTISKPPVIDSEEEDLTVSNLINLMGYAEGEAIEEIYGDEVASAWYEYEGVGKLGRDDFIEEYVDEISSGACDVEDILRIEAVQPFYDDYKKAGGKYDLHVFADEYGDSAREGNYSLASSLEKEALNVKV